MGTVITEPGVYQLDDAEYHADPVPGGSLSASGAKLLLPPSCPARFHHYRTHGRPPKREFDLGHAAHLQVLGAGPELAVVDAPDWRTKAAREARDQAYAAGRVPLLAGQHQQVTDMAAALRRHPIAGELLDPGRMVAEQSLFWIDDEGQAATPVWRRARIDALSRPGDIGALVVDYKTCRSADVEHISRAMWLYGYAMQAAWYLDAATATGLIHAGLARFLFVFQEIDPPYVVSVIEPDATALRIGAERNREAIETYRMCVESGQWPGHVPDDAIPTIPLPAWAERQYAEPEELIL